MFIEAMAEDAVRELRGLSEACGKLIETLEAELDSIDTTAEGGVKGVVYDGFRDFEDEDLARVYEKQVKLLNNDHKYFGLLLTGLLYHAVRHGHIKLGMEIETDFNVELEVVEFEGRELFLGRKDGYTLPNIRIEATQSKG